MDDKPGTRSSKKTYPRVFAMIYLEDERQKTLIKQAASESGLSVSEWAREILVSAASQAQGSSKRASVR